MTDAGVERLAGLAKLATLDLSGTKITDTALETLGKLPALKVVDVSFTGLTEAAVAKFRAAHPGIKVTR